MFLHTIFSGLNPFSKIFVWEAYTHVVTIWVRQKPLRRFFHAEPRLSTITFNTEHKTLRFKSLQMKIIF